MSWQFWAFDDLFKLFFTGMIVHHTSVILKHKFGAQFENDLINS